jgi:hypothetical protein
MPTRKQRRRRQQKFRHEQAWYEVDEFGNEIEVHPAEVKAAEPEKRTNGAKPGAKASAQRGGRQGTRSGRVPPEPSWGRAARRGALFIPFTFWIDRLAYRRWQAKASGAAPAKKR